MSVLAFPPCPAPCPAPCQHGLPLGPPPGVLTGLPLVMLEVKPTLDMYAVPEQWLENDLPIIEGMMDVIEGDIESEYQEKITQIDNELVWMDLCRDESYFFIDEGQFDSFYSGQSVKESNVADDEYKSCMSQFEQDFDYEQSLILEQKGNDEINLHRLLASPPEDRVGWCGNSNWRSDVDGFVFSALLNERYRFPALQITHPFPSDRRGYALAQSVYGKVYIPEKFRNFIPAPGQGIDATVALQDVEGRGGVSQGGKANTFRFSAIFMHTDNLGIH